MHTTRAILSLGIDSVLDAAHIPALRVQPTNFFALNGCTFRTKHQSVTQTPRACKRATDLSRADLLLPAAHHDARCPVYVQNI